MAGWPRRRTQRRRNWAWYSVLGVALGVPFFLIAVALLKKVWHGSCLPLGLSETANCKSSELIIVVAAVLGAVGMVILLWWVLNEFTGLRRIFEVPWVGVGSDVENAGAMESMLRAAVFIFVLWLCIALIFPYGMSLLGLPPPAALIPAPPASPQEQSAKAPGPPQEQSAQTPAPAQEPSVKPPTNPDTGTSPADSVLIDQLKLANSTLGSVKELLSQHGERLSAIQKKLDGWNPGQGPAPDGGISTILKEAAAKIDQNVKTIAEQTSEQSRRLMVLDTIYLALLENPRPRRNGECFEYVADAPSVTKPETAAPSSPGNVNRYRTAAAVRHVFFDRGSSTLSDWAKQDISWFLRETNARDGKLAIFGSTDPQGTEAQNALLAKNRALAIQQFIQDEKTPHQIISVKSATEDGTPKSEPYKRVATIRLLEPCQQ